MRIGIVTLLFTDLVGSTELLTELGDDAADRVRRKHFRLLRDHVDRCGGQEVKNLGDGVMAVFPSAVDAANCAVAMQQAVLTHNMSASGPTLSLRIGIHTGEPIREKDDYFGQPVVVAKRLCDRAEGGQIVVSDLVESIIGPRGRFDFVDLGWLALKGVGTPVPGRALLWETAAKNGDSQARVHDAEHPPRGRRRTVVAAAATVLVAAGALAVAELLNAGHASAPRPEASARLHWARANPDGAEFEGAGDQRINRLYAGERGLVAVGLDSSSGGLDPAAWISQDGITWTRAAARPLHQARGQAMTGVTGGGPGLVAVGWTSSAGDLDAAVWVSRDGTEWRPATGAETALGGAGDQVMNRVGPGGPGLVAVGYEATAGDHDGAIWTSPDGLVWTRVESSDSVLGGLGDQEVRSVSTAGDRLVAVGYDDSRGHRDAAVWLSDNGRTWDRVRHVARIFGGPAEQYMNAVTAHGSTFVAVGWDTLHTSQDAAAWTSSDGSSWERVPQNELEFGGRGSQIIYGVDSGRGGLVAVGRDTNEGGSDAAVWFSEDGVTWTRSPGAEAILGGDRAQEMRWVTVFDGRLIGAGWDKKGGRGEDAAVWWADLP